MGNIYLININLTTEKNNIWCYICYKSDALILVFPVTFKPVTQFFLISNLFFLYVFKARKE